MSNPDPKTLTDAEIVEGIRTAESIEYAQTLIAEAQNRINKRNRAKHEPDCQCVDCAYIMED